MRKGRLRPPASADRGSGRPTGGPDLLAALAGRLGRDSAAYTGGFALTLLLGLLNVAVLTRFIPPAAYGELALLLLLSGLLTLLYNLPSLQGAFSWIFGAAGEEEADDIQGADLARDKRRALGTAMAVTALTALCGTAVVVALNEPLAELITGDPSDASLVDLAAASGAVGAVWRLVVNVPRLERRPTNFVVLSNSRPLLILAVALPLVIGGGGVEAVLVGTLIGTAASLAIGLAAIRPSFVFAFDRGGVAEIAGRSGLFVPVIAAFWVIQNVDIFILSAFAKEADVGIYRAASRIGALTSYMVSAFLMAWTPLPRTALFAAAERVGGYARLGGATARYYFLLGLWFLLGLAVGADALVQVAGPSYDRAAPLIPLIGLSFLAYGAFVVMYRASRFPRRRQRYVTLAIISAGVFVAAAFPLTALFGPYGTALSPTLGFGVGCAALAYLARRSTEPTRFGWVRIGAAAGIAGVCFAGERLLTSVAPPLQPLGAALALAAYPALLLATGVVPRAQVSRLRHVSAVVIRGRLSAPLDSAHVARLQRRERTIVELLLKHRLSAGEVAAVVRVPEARVQRWFAECLRGLLGLPRGGKHEARVGAYLLSTAPVAERDGIARDLWESGVDPQELNALDNATLQLRQALAPRRLKRSRRAAESELSGQQRRGSPAGKR